MNKKEKQQLQEDAKKQGDILLGLFIATILFYAGVFYLLYKIISWALST